MLSTSIFWVAHVVAFAGFLVILPTTKLRHMFTSPANMFLSPRQRPKGAMRPVPNLMETDDIESVGAAEITEFTWKQLLDTDACTICGRCTSVCPAQLTGKPLDPREIVIKLGEVAALTGSPAVSPPVSMVDGITVSSASVFERIQPEEVWSCTSCKACDEICPVNIEILDKILDMRRHLSLMASEFPAELGKAYMAMENQSNPWGMSQQSRADWTASLDFDVPVLGRDGVESADYLYWVGCAGSFDDRNRTVTISMARLMHHAGLDFAILGPRELCTGDPARRSGNEYVFQQLALQNIATLDEFGVRTVVTQCPHCFNTLANEYPQLGGSYEVIHHSQLLAELMRRGLVPSPDGGEGEITYHDPCYLGRHNDVYLPTPRGCGLGRRREPGGDAAQWQPRHVLWGRGCQVLDGGAHREEGQRGAGGGGGRHGRIDRGRRLPVLLGDDRRRGQGDRARRRCAGPGHRLDPRRRPRPIAHSRTRRLSSAPTRQTAAERGPRAALVVPSSVAMPPKPHSVSNW